MKPFKSPEILPGPGERLDSFMQGRLKLIQSLDGYRFSIDAVLLAEFVTTRPGDVVVELGSGCGVILLILLLKNKIARAFALEIQEELASQAARNAALNGFDDRMHVIAGDMKSLPLIEGIADVVICNPPYRKLRSGRINPDPRRAIARHELMADIDDILKAGVYLLKKRGRLAMIYPSARLVDLTVKMRRFHLEPKRIRINYPDKDSKAKLALVEAWLRGKPGVDIGPPLLGQGDMPIKNQI